MQHPKYTQCRNIINFLDDINFSLSSPETERQKNLKKFKSVASIQNQASEYLSTLNGSKSVRVSLINVERIVEYMKIHPLAREQVFKDGGISDILQLRESTKDNEITKQTRVALALLGYVNPVQGRGIRILTLDGGGTRGVMVIEMLKKISDLCQQPIHELFDLIVGTSTGAILAFLIGVQKQSLEKCESLYAKLSHDIFDASRIVGTGKLFLNHAYYDASKLEDILKDELGDKMAMIDTTASLGPKVAAVSSLVNQQVLQAYVFRNYCLRADLKNMYAGSSKHKLWQAVRASTAAPGYFEEYLLDGEIHQDGGLLTNNPCALAIREAKSLWPTTPIQAVISLGTGMYHGRAGPSTVQFTTLREKLMKLVASATDVEAVHIILQDLLPPSKYVRLNPNMSSDVPLDECRPEMLRQLEQDARNYINKFSHKFDAASEALLRHKTFSRKCIEKVELKSSVKGWM